MHRLNFTPAVVAAGTLAAAAVPAIRPANEEPRAILAAIVNADEAFLEAAELRNLGLIDQDRYQRAADAVYTAIERAADYLAATNN